MIQSIGRARAHTNIALIKYWGKRDKELFLPMNSSLSLTLAAFYTDTQVRFDTSLDDDHFYLNGKEAFATEKESVTRFLNLFRQEFGETRPASVESYNFVPTAAGLASSASAFAALALAVKQALQLPLDSQTLSTYARRGSGSSTRSLFGGFVEWDKGTCSADSQALPVDDASWDIAMIILLVSADKKAIPSRIGMDHTVATSPFYSAWVSSAQEDLEAMKAAIFAHDFKTVGEITEHNAMKMHATTLSANPPFSYWEPESVRLQQLIRRIRQESGLSAYITMDAGPNVKVLCRASELEALLTLITRDFPKEKTIVSLPGSAAYSLTETDWQVSKETFYAKKE